MLKYIVIGPWLRLLFRPEVQGLQHVPSTGPAIIASNHLTFIDSLFVSLVVGRKVAFPAKIEYFTGTGVKGWLSRAFFAGTGQVPIDRRGGRAARAALDVALQVLRGGNL